MQGGVLYFSPGSPQPWQVLLTCSLEPVFQSPPCSRAGPVPPREAPAGHEVPHVTGSRSGARTCRWWLLDLTPQGANGPGSLPGGCSQPTCHSLHSSYGFQTLEQKVSAWLYLRAQLTKPVFLNFSFPLLKLCLLLFHYFSQ